MSDTNRRQRENKREGQGQGQKHRDRDRETTNKTGETDRQTDKQRHGDTVTGHM